MLAEDVLTAWRRRRRKWALAKQASFASPDRANLVLHLSGEDLSGTEGSNVTSWPARPDCLVTDGLTGVTATKPTLKLSAMNGKKGVYFGGSAGLFNDAVAAYFTGEAKPFTLIVVVQRDGLANSEYAITCGSSSSSTPLIFFLDYYRAVIELLRRSDSGAVKAPTSSTITSLGCIDSVVDNGVVGNCWRDGVQISTNADTAVAGANTLDTFTVGGWRANGGFSTGLSGTICELFLYKTALSVANRAYIEAHLMDKYGYNATYYVDSVAGSDSNDGKGLATPFATISKLLSADASEPRNTHKLIDGSVFREQYTVPPRENTTLTGSAELIASTIIAAGAWSKTAGKTNVYQISVSGMLTGGFVRVWEDDIGLTLAADLATCDSTPGTYWVSTHDSTETIYVHASESGNPASDGCVYEHSGKREHAYFGGTRATIRGITCKRNYNNNGTATIGRYSKAFNCQFSDGTRHVVYLNGGIEMTDCVVDENYYPLPGGSTLFVYYDYGGDYGLTFTRCTARKTVYDSEVSGWFGHLVEANGMLTFATLTDCVAINVNGGYVLPNISTVTLSSCRSTGCPSVFLFSQAAVVEINGGSFESTSESSSYFLMHSTAGPATFGSLSMTGVTALIAHGGKSVLNISGFEGSVSLVNCSVSPVAPTLRADILAVLSASASASVYVRGCSFDCGHYIIMAGTDVDSDYNTFTAPMNNEAFKIGEDNKTFAQWQALGHDLNSTVA